MEKLFEWGGGMWGGIGLAVLQILVFVVILLFGLAYAWRKGVLSWQ